MPPYGEPDWATPGDTTNAVTQVAGTTVPVTAASGTNSNSGETRNRARCLITLLSAINMGLAGLMAALGILTLINFEVDSADEYSEAFLAVYMVIFAMILFLYELMYWMAIGWINRSFRKNFGFMYGLKGKGFYLVFIAFLCLGLRDDNSSGVNGLDWTTGVAWLAAGCVHVFIGFTMPEVSDAYKPPTAGLQSDDVGENVV